MYILILLSHNNMKVYSQRIIILFYNLISFTINQKVSFCWNTYDFWTWQSNMKKSLKNLCEQIFKKYYKSLCL